VSSRIGVLDPPSWHEEDGLVGVLDQLVYHPPIVGALGLILPLRKAETQSFIGRLGQVDELVSFTAALPLQDFPQSLELLYEVSGDGLPDVF
jgi:hypothetical protein